MFSTLTKSFPLEAVRTIPLEIMVNLNKTQSKESLKVYDQARAVLKHHRSKKEEIFARKLGFWVRYTKGLGSPSMCSLSLRS